MEHNHARLVCTPGCAIANPTPGAVAFFCNRCAPFLTGVAERQPEVVVQLQLVAWIPPPQLGDDVRR